MKYWNKLLRRFKRNKGRSLVNSYISTCGEYIKVEYYPDGYTVSSRFNRNRELIFFMDSNGRREWYTYNDDGKMSSRQFEVDNKLCEEVYDLHGRISSMNNSSNNTTIYWEYNDDGKCISMGINNPDMDFKKIESNIMLGVNKSTIN